MRSAGFSWTWVKLGSTLQDDVQDWQSIRADIILFKQENVLRLHFSPHCFMRF